MPNQTEARPAKASRSDAPGDYRYCALFSTPHKTLNEPYPLTCRRLANLLLRFCPASPCPGDGSHVYSELTALSKNKLGNIYRKNNPEEI